MSVCTISIFQLISEWVHWRNVGLFLIVCADKNSNCPYWARTKQCQVNPRYMLRNCRKSCKVCGVVKPKPTPKPTRVTVGVKKGENVARRRPTKQSSIHHKGSPNRAVDGKRSTSYAANSCTHTGWDFHPWWRVDIGNPNSKVRLHSLTFAFLGSALEHVSTVVKASDKRQALSCSLVPLLIHQIFNGHLVNS